MKTKKLLYSLLLILVTALTACSQSSKSENENIAIDQITFEVPEGYVEVQPNFWFTEELQQSGPNINLIESERSTDIDAISPEELEDAIVHAYANQGLIIKNFESSEVENFQIDGFDAAKLTMNYDMEDVHVSQLQVLIVSFDEEYAYTFTDIDNSGAMADFEKAAETFSITEKEVE